MKAIIHFVIFLLGTATYAQLPKTDLYLATFSDLENQPLLQELTFLNDFNKNGYNNQPNFISAAELFVTIGNDTSRHTDLYRLNLNSREFFKFTDTDGISEFSGNLTPTKGHVTCVRIEPDGKDQSLWSYPEDRKSTGKRLLPSLKNVGYYCWITKNEVALFLVGNPHKLVITNLTTGKNTLITENVGRCLKYDGKNLFFVHKITSDTWYLKSWDQQTKKTTLICQMPTGREDYEVLPNGNFLTADGSKLKMYQPNISTSWTDIADFADRNIKNINRVSAYGSKVVFVNNR